MAGRATGRARGRPAAGGDSPTGSGDGSPTGSGSPIASQQSSNRGRGGYRPEFVTTRPEETTALHGEGGRPVALFANYFSVNAMESSGVWDYRVDFNPDVESVRVRRSLIEGLADRFNGAYLFDGMSNLKSLALLDAVNLTTVLETTNAAAAPANGGVAPPVTVTFRRSGEQIAWGSIEMMRLYNTQMRRNFQHLSWLLIFRNFYDPSTRVSIPDHSVDVMLGLSTAINNHDAGILVACDTINKIIRRDTVLQVMQKIYRMAGNFQDNIRRELIGSIVMTNYNNRTYKIDDIDFTQSPESTFDKRGVQTSFLAYYQQQYNLTITDTRQPLITCLPTARDRRFAEQNNRVATTHLLIPEFCLMTGLSESLRGNFELKKQLTQSTQLAPPERFNQLMGFRRKLQENANIQADMKTWGLSYSPQLVSLTGRVLPNEVILIGGNKDPARAIQIRDPGEFSKEIRSSCLQVANVWSRWAVLVPQRCHDFTTDFLNTFRRVSEPLGLRLTPPLIKVLNDDRTPTFLSTLQELNVPPDGMVVCIVPNNNKDRYDAIKKRCCIESPCASQVILSKTLSKKQQLMSVATKICLQMACKAGSEAWNMNIPVKKAMAVGYDTYHDGARKGESVGAFVASLNDAMARYFSRVSYHKNNDEMSVNIAFSMRQALEQYRKVNGGALPERVIMFRDGVGEGMIAHVFKIELQKMREVLLEVAGSAPPPKLAFIIVTKRINTKFFLKNEQAKRLENPCPGTVVDSVVTRPERLEFFLVAQSVRHGTVAPVSFNIICNEVKWQPKHFQMLSYKLCHMYFNWPGTIRVPAVCQYAHKLAFLTGTSLHREPHTALSDRLFFL